MSDAMNRIIERLSWLQPDWSEERCRQAADDLLDIIEDEELALAALETVPVM